MSLNKVKIKVIHHVPTWNHLRFVKILKDHTGLGLANAKYLSDDIKTMYDRSSNQWVELDIITDAHSLKRDFSEFGFRVEVIDKSEERNLKLMSIGLGDKFDLVESISKELSIELYNRVKKETKSDLDIIFKSYFEDLLIDLSDEKLIEILNKRMNNGERMGTL
jgi:hypothetical protein